MGTTEKAKGRAGKVLDAAGAARSRADLVGMLAVGGVMVALVAVMGRVVQLQTKPSEQLSRFVSERLTTIPEKAPHGTIYDRRGRVLATTRFGHGVFIDPREFPVPPDEAIAKLADATGMSTLEIAKRIIPELEKAHATEVPESDDPNAPTGEPKKYLAIGDTLEDWRVELVRALKIDDKPIPGVHLETRPVREYTSEDVAGHLVGMVGSDHAGLSGAELLYQTMLKPETGSLRYVRDAKGEPMWIFPGGYQPGERGDDIRMSIDLEIQRIVVEELKRGIKDADAAGGRCVVVDPYTGEILAMADIVIQPKDARPYKWDHVIPKGGDGTRYQIIPKDELAPIHASLARNRCVEDVYEPGSTFKPFIWATCLESNVVRPEEVFQVHYGEWTTPYGRHLSDVVDKYATMTWKDVLVNSSNIGMAQGGARLTFKQARDGIREFGFGQRTGLGFVGETPGLVTSEKAWSKYTQTSVSIGYEVGVTPVQMARAFSAFCRTGDKAGTLPTLRLTAAEFDATSNEQPVRVLPARIAELTRETMRGVTHKLDTRLADREGSAQETFRYEAFGKSGTARAPLGKPPKDKKKPKGSDGYFGGQYNVSFIAGGPAADPRVVVLVVVDDPGPELVRKRLYYGAMVAGPVNRRIMERTLSYLGAEPSVGPGESVAGSSGRD